jgi:hypothetical protein
MQKLHLETSLPLPAPFFSLADPSYAPATARVAVLALLALALSSLVAAFS